MTPMSNSWALRIANMSRICENCDCHIRPGVRYFLMVTGERFCCECPPSGAEDLESICD